MQLSDTFSIARPVDEAWQLLHDPGRLAPCVPGAQLTAVHGDRYDGIVSVRLGVLAARFEGSATFDYDDDRRRVTVQAAGAGNHGDAEAHITARLEPLSDDSTQVNVDTDLQIGNYIRGKVWEILIIGSASYLTFAFFDLRFALLLGITPSFGSGAILVIKSHVTVRIDLLVLVVRLSTDNGLMVKCFNRRDRCG